MGTLTVGAILDRAELTLLDEDNVRWDREELRGHYNAGVRMIVGFKPDAYVTTAVVTFAAGSQQAIPDGGTAYRALLCNIASDGTTAGSAIFPCARADLDLSLPAWRLATGDEVEHVVFDPENPKVYHIYPSTSGKGLLTYGDTPTDSTLDADVLPIDDLYDAVLHDYVVGLALQKNSKSGNIARADWYANRVAQALGLRSQGQFQFTSQPTRQSAQGGG